MAGMCISDRVRGSEGAISRAARALEQGSLKCRCQGLYLYYTAGPRTNRLERLITIFTYPGNGSAIDTALWFAQGVPFCLSLKSNTDILRQPNSLQQYLFAIIYGHFTTTECLQMSNLFIIQMFFGVSPRLGLYP